MELLVTKVVGWTLILISVFMILRFKSLRKSMREGMKSNRQTFFMFGFYELILGLLIVTSYNVWEVSYRLIITLIGWGAIVEGIMLIAFPKTWLAKVVNWSTRGSLFMIWALVGLILGAYLLVQTGSMF